MQKKLSICNKCDKCDFARNEKCKNAIIFASREMPFLMIIHNAINSCIYHMRNHENFSLFSLFSQFFAFIIFCEKYYLYSKNARNAIIFVSQEMPFIAINCRCEKNARNAISIAMLSQNQQSWCKYQKKLKSGKWFQSHFHLSKLDKQSDTYMTEQGDEMYQNKNKRFRSASMCVCVYIKQRER